jgi:hypothetical protein
MVRQRHREGEDLKFYIEIVKYTMLKKNSGETKLHKCVPCVKHLIACIGLIILGLSSRIWPEFLTEYGSVLLVGQCLFPLCMLNVVTRF